MWAAPAAPLVVVLSGNPDAPFVRRLAAELSLFGYRVEVAGRSADDAELSTVLTRHEGAALISVDQGTQTAEVVVAARPGTTEPRRELERLDPRRRADTNAAVLAERFRARLTELGIPPGAAPASTQLPASQVAPLPGLAPEPERRLWLAGSVGASAGGLGALPEAALELRAFPVRWLSTSAFGKLSLGRAHVSAPEGNADVRLLAGGLLIDVYPVRGPVSVNVGVGALLVDAEMSGRAAPPWQGRDVSVLVPGAIFQAGAGLRLAPRVSAELRGFIGACSPSVAVRIAEQKAASFGQPLVGASIGVAVGVF
ncbi:MAG: hypothetical protein K0R38_7003 [Polyangiaceae bacterium]|nr:hypothetical protein [Polyangiaceae bacterium]